MRIIIFINLLNSLQCVSKYPIRRGSEKLIDPVAGANCRDNSVPILASIKDELQIITKAGRSDSQ